MSTTRSLTAMASTSDQTTITVTLSLSVSHAAVLQQLILAEGSTLEEKRIAVRQWICAQIETSLGAEFLPVAGGPMVQEVDFDDLTGKLRVQGIIGGELVQTGE